MFRALFLSAVISVTATGAIAETSTHPTRVVGARTVEASVSTVLARVETVDRRTRQVLVRYEDGTYETHRLPASVRNFNQIKEGDIVQLDVTDTIIVALERGQARTPEETTGVASAPRGARPGLAVQNVSQITAQVDSVNPATRQVVLRGADGKPHTVRAPDDVNISEVKPGDTVVATLVESVVIAVRAAP